jgi:hypothetical protein
MSRALKLAATSHHGACGFYAGRPLRMPLPYPRRVSRESLELRRGGCPKAMARIHGQTTFGLSLRQL